MVELLIQRLLDVAQQAKQNNVILRRGHPARLEVDTKGRFILSDMKDEGFSILDALLAFEHKVAEGVEVQEKKYDRQSAIGAAAMRQVREILNYYQISLSDSELFSFYLAMDGFENKGTKKLPASIRRIIEEVVPAVYA